MIHADLNNKRERLLLSIFIALFLSLCPLFSVINGDSEIPAQVEKVKRYEKGELRIIEGIPFLKLSGSYYEMGEQYGALLKDEFQKIYQEVLPYKSVILPKQPDDIYSKLERLTSDKFINQLKGMSVGSGLPYNDLLLASYFGVLERGGCTSILAKIKGENDILRLVHGRNFDYGKGMGKYPIVVEYQPDGEWKHLAIGTIASAGLAEGMNEKGITVSGNLAPGDLKNNTIQNASTDIIFREILSSASSLKEVDELMNGYASDVGNTFTIGSGIETNGIIYDMNYNNVKKNFFNKQNYIFATNGYVHKDLNPVKDDLRYQIIQRYIDDGKISTIDGMIEVLSDPGTSFGVNNPGTIHSVVFDPQQKTIYMAFNTKFAAWSQWLKYDWKKGSVSVYKKADKDKLLNTDSVELTEVHIIGAYWNGHLPVLNGGQKSKQPFFWISIKEWLKEKNVEQLSEFRERAAKELTLKAKNLPDIKATITKGMIAMENFYGFMFKINEEDVPKIVPNTPYTIHFENTSAVYKWVTEEGITLIKPEDK
jgi:hypothetical protein